MKELPNERSYTRKSTKFMTIYVKFDIHIREISIYAKYTKQRQEADGSPPGAKGHAGWEEGGIVWEHGEHLRG